jgi:predicted DCC family thiol-disulfide oxidoreductase YuxK
MAELPKGIIKEATRPFCFQQDRRNGEKRNMGEAEMTKEKERATLIYDGKCPICNGTVKWIKENEVEGTFEMLPCQSERIDSEFPDVKRDECMQAMHLVLPDGKVFVGERAMPEIFRRLKRYRFAATFFRLPGAQTFSRIAYRWFADRRYTIAGILSHLTGKRKAT